jgi:hypothetical protein
MRMYMVEWSIFNEIFAVAFNVLYFVIIIGTIFIVILDNRNPVKTMAWVLVLFFLPIVGLVFYFFFGRSTRKEKLISKKGFTRLIKRPMAEYQAQKAFKCPDEQHQLMREVKTDKCFPIRADVFRFIDKCSEQFDFIFADPPYALKELESIPTRIFESGILKEDGLLVLEHGKENHFEDDPHFIERRAYGSVNFSFFKATVPATGQ